MRATVRDAFLPYTKPLEGVVPWMYLDVKGLVTVGIGNLIDPVGAALACPFVRADGSPATREEIGSEWAIVKNHTELAHQGYRAAKQWTRLHLTEEGIADVVGRKLDEMWSYLAHRFPEIESWPGDAQLATISMSWACGPAFRFPALELALRAKDFVLASTQCTINENGNPGVVPRNAANRTLYVNAARVIAWGMDPDQVYFPRELKVPPDAVTKPELPVLEDDGGLAREDATSDAVHDGAEAEVTDRHEEEDP